MEQKTQTIRFVHPTNQDIWIDIKWVADTAIQEVTITTPLGLLISVLDYNGFNRFEAKPFTDGQSSVKLTMTKGLFETLCIKIEDPVAVQSQPADHQLVIYQIMAGIDNLEPMAVIHSVW